MVSDYIEFNDIFTLEVKKSKTIPAVSLVIPTRNEAGNVDMLLNSP